MRILAFVYVLVFQNFKGSFLSMRLCVYVGNFQYEERVKNCSFVSEKYFKGILFVLSLSLSFCLRQRFCCSYIIFHSFGFRATYFFRGAIHLHLHPRTHMCTSSSPSILLILFQKVSIALRISTIKYSSTCMYVDVMAEGQKVLFICFAIFTYFAKAIIVTRKKMSS